MDSVRCDRSRNPDARPCGARGSRTTLKLTLALTLLAAILPATSRAVVPDWPDVFDPTVIHNLNISTMAATDTTCVGAEDPTTWTAIQQDGTFLVEHPVLFWADGETPICVTLRRKSSPPLGPPADPKVGLKLDINELVSGQRWHGLRKLSLENGGTFNPAAEGIAWQMYRLAANAPGAPPDFTPGFASWVTLVVNGTSYGIYVNPEQKDKSYLQNRDLHTGLVTWLYKAFGNSTVVAKVPTGSDANAGTDSSTHLTLCYAPFVPVTCATPPSPAFENEIDALVDMDVMLTQATLSAFIVATDQMFTGGQNYYQADWNTPINRKRRYFPWDFDDVFNKVDEGIDCRTRQGSCQQRPRQALLLGTSTSPGIAARISWSRGSSAGITRLPRMCSITS